MELLFGRLKNDSYTGKVNDNFQYSRMLNRLFKHRKTELLVPAYGHSFLSA